MIRFASALFHIWGLLFISLLFGDGVDVSMNVPGKIDAGKEITVQVTLQKGDLTGFSRFQMELPDGLTATSVNSANADFSFSDQKIRLIWLRLPDEASVTFSFNIQCKERLKGNFDLKGTFSYIDNNERKSAETGSQQVAIVPDPNIDPSLLVDIHDYGKSAYPSGGIPLPGQIVCIRQHPVWNSQNNEIDVTLLVNKESLQKFAKIEEDVPAGYTALSIDSKNGIFTFRDQKVKFLWMNLPAEPYFTVSYKLIPLKAEANKTPEIKGAFSYIADDKTESVNIIEKDVDLASLTPEAVKAILSEPAYMAGITGQSSTTPASQTSNSGKEDTGTIAQNIPASQQQATTTPVSTATTATSGTKTGAAQTAMSDLLEPQSGIYYRVQIAAGHRPVNIKRYFRKYKLDNTVFREKHNGWLKYSIGSFDEYKAARDYRVHIWNTTTIDDAFVAAYNDGKRITVQEALMIANQKWYR